MTPTEREQGMEATPADAAQRLDMKPQREMVSALSDLLPQVLQLCHARGVPVVPRGAGTGLSGGALPHGAGVLLSLAKLNRIIEVDPHSRTATVQPGVRNLAIS